LTKKAAIYLRQSVDNAEGIERQRERCIALALARNWEVVAEFEDNEVRASKERGAGTAWDRMLDRMPEFDVVIAVDLDRLLRSTRDLHTLIDRGASVVTVDGEIDLSTADGEFRATMLAGIARFEVRRAGERIKRAVDQRAANGEWHGGNPPFGYRSAGTKLEVIDEEKALILYAAERVLEGHSLHSIVKGWNDNGVTTRSGKHWRQTNLRSILRNKSLLGETKAGVVGWDAILTPDQFARLDRIFSDASRKVTHSPGVRSTKYALGGGITLCGVCGKRMTAARHHDYTALVCLSRVNGPDPVNHPKRTRPDGKRVDTKRVTVNYDRLESLVLDSIKARLEKDGWESVAAEREPATDSRIRELEAESEALLERQRKVNDLFLSDSMDVEQHGSEIQRIKARREEITNEVSRLHGMPVVAGLIKDGLDFSNKKLWTSDRKRALLKGLGVRVYVDPWPDGVPHNPSRRAGESDAERDERLERHHREVLIERVRIVYPSGR